MPPASMRNWRPSMWTRTDSGPGRAGCHPAHGQRRSGGPRPGRTGDFGARPRPPAAGGDGLGDFLCLRGAAAASWWPCWRRMGFMIPAIGGAVPGGLALLGAIAAHVGGARVAWAPCGSPSRGPRDGADARRSAPWWGSSTTRTWRLAMRLAWSAVACAQSDGRARLAPAQSAWPRGSCARRLRGATDAQRIAADLHHLQLLEDVIRHAHRQVHEAVILADLDMTDVATVDARLIGDGADDVAGKRTVRIADLDAEGFQRRRRFAPATTAGVAIAFKARAALRGAPSRAKRCGALAWRGVPLAALARGAACVAGSGRFSSRNGVEPCLRLARAAAISIAGTFCSVSNCSSSG